MPRFPPEPTPQPPSGRAKSYNIWDDCGGSCCPALQFHEDGDDVAVTVHVFIRIEFLTQLEHEWQE
jgi:hypothetical protein